MDWLNYTLFTFNGDTPVLLIDLITSIAGLTCVFYVDSGTDLRILSRTQQ